MLMRLQKFLAMAEVASRRKSEELIFSGRVSVNGRVVTEAGTKVDSASDTVCVDGRKVDICDKKIYIMLHKPTGCITTANDQFGRRSVMDYIDIEERIYPVGRLDYDTSGLLLLTNDGELTYRLTHPKHNIDKTYIATVDREPAEADIKRFSEGIMLDGRRTAPARIDIADKNPVKLEITIHEGRNRQVRKMCEAIGCRVLRLERIAVGELTLGSLKKGKYRHLTEKEVAYLKEL